MIEDILKKANELGLMIRGTDVAERFEELSKKVNEDKEASALLEEYIGVSQELQEKEASGQAIEVEDKQRIQELGEKAAQNQLLKEYIATQTYYFNMMIQIQNAISEPKGEPIKESKIITPGGGGKIITGV